jgi:hypothetical protein
MSYNLVINSTNVANSLNNMYQYNFIKGSFEIPEGAEMMISTFQIPYSWYNITAKYNNNSFKLYFPTSTSTYTAFTVTIPDGFYTTTSLNAYIQQFCITNGLYLIDGGGNYVYYVSVQYNATYYANQLIAKLVPVSLPTGYTAPSNWIGYPTVSRTPYIEILSTSNFGTYLGFSVGTYGINQTSNYSINSNLIPVGSTVNSLIIRCSLVNNNVSSPTDVMDSFPINGTFGANLNYNNQIEKWIKLSPGKYNNFIVSIVDQNLNDISILDSNLLINFIIRVKK